MISLIILFVTVRPVLRFSPSDEKDAGLKKELVEKTPASWLRDTRVEERDDHYLVKMSVPGMSEGELEVKLESGVLTVIGRRNVSDQVQEGRSSRSYSLTSSFQKTCVLPKAAGPEITESRVEDGMLLVKISKTSPSDARSR